ncbi:glycerol kinase GlpK [Saccharibacillus sp. CPCC 101409]|uniref:glycerol kinase GlpK n=1 Tax=Saccharibacillus sp. CPCC 101409 TaxID=3058041 RepID=UPI002671522C|nr:glycerol kinase GlpK [Saccharibacillus sp. CPCC 101409]MDO3409584.1 glycerol kinase GlpK [Saccharibacillus sp. CPCC 101409]
MSGTYILALDQGTTSSRAIVFDENARPVAAGQRTFTQHFPSPGRVEHNAEEIWSSQLDAAREAIASAGISPSEIAAIGITNQRETTLVWDRGTGTPIGPAIVWQDRRTAALCEDLKKRGLEPYIRETTGLVVDAYFSATKISWMLEHVPGARARAEAGELLAGTVDSWLIWKLTGGASHVTDVTNASRTMLFDIGKLEWDAKLLQELNIPASMLPDVLMSGADFGRTLPQWFDGASIPISSVLGDQQAALFGHACVEAGHAKNTYGTGCFILLNTGTDRVDSDHGLLSTIAWGWRDELHYALEGSVFVAGAAVEWLKDGLNLIEDPDESERLASEVEDSGGVVIVPAFTGLGAPYWDMYARGAVFGLTRGTQPGHIARATLESLALQTRDVTNAMEKDSGIPLKELRVDGGAVKNNILMQFQADILGLEVVRTEQAETTALGAAMLAGLQCGLWEREQFRSFNPPAAHFRPQMKAGLRERTYRRWQNAIGRTRGWEDPEES